MTLFLDWRRPICHSSFVTFHYVTCHTPQRLSPLRLILSLSVLLRIPPSSDRTDCIYVCSSFVSIPSLTILIPSLSRTLFHGAGASRASHTSSGPQRRTRALGIRRAPTVLSSVRPVLQQWCIDLHLRVFTLRKNYWSPAASPHTVRERLVSSFISPLSSKLWKQSHLGTSVWADLSGAVNSSPRRTCPYPGASERWKAYTVGLVPFLQPSQQELPQ